MDYSTLFTPLTPEIISFVDSLIKAVGKMFAEPGFKRISPCVQTLNKGNRGIYMMAFDFDEKTKPIVGNLIHKLKQENEAVAFIAEAWVTWPDPKKNPAMCAAIDSGRDVVMIAPRLHPERHERATVQLHIKERRIIFAAPISRVDGKPVLGDWDIQVDSANPEHKMQPMRFE